MADIMPQTRPVSAPEAPSDGARRYVFVYGTLRRGCANDITRLSPPPEFVAEARVRGTLYRLGWYPGLRLAPGHAHGGDEVGGGMVTGEIYAIEPALEAKLDEIEEVYPQGSQEYARRHVPVQALGRSWTCLVYEASPEVCAGKPLIANGDWVLQGGRLTAP